VSVGLGVAQPVMQTTAVDIHTLTCYGYSHTHAQHVFHMVKCFIHITLTMLRARQTGGASDFMKNSDLGDYVDAIIGPAPSGLTEGGYKKRGSIAVSKIDASGFYYLNVEGEPGHALKCILQVICRHIAGTFTCAQV
jgi:hypothetical protein